MTRHVYACKTSPYYILQMRITYKYPNTLTAICITNKNGMKWNESFPVNQQE